MDRAQLDTPWLYPLRLRPPDRVEFIALDRDAFRAEPFHDVRIEARYPSAGSLSARGLVEWHEQRSGTGTGAPRFIFHHGFALSTLLSRWLDRPGLTFTLREPSVLTDLGRIDLEDRHALRGANGRALLSAVLALLCRTEHASEVPVIKGCDSLTGVIALLLEICPDARGVLLYSDLDTFVLSCVKAQARRQWARDRVIAFRAWDLPERLWALDPTPLGDGEIAACLWAMHVNQYTRLAHEFRGRLQPCHCEQLVATPHEAAARISDFFGLHDPSGAALAPQSAAATHAKTGAPYGAAQRARELTELAAQFASELDHARGWLEDNIAAIPIDRALVSSSKKSASS